MTTSDITSSFGEHVRRIEEQGERVGEDADDDLDGMKPATSASAIESRLALAPR